VGAAHANTCGWVYNEVTGDLQATYYNYTLDKLDPLVP